MCYPISDHLAKVTPENAEIHNGHLSEMFFTWKDAGPTEGNRHDRDVITTFRVLSNLLHQLSHSQLDYIGSNLDVPCEDEAAPLPPPEPATLFQTDPVPNV